MEEVKKVGGSSNGWTVDDVAKKTWKVQFDAYYKYSQIIQLKRVDGSKGGLFIMEDIPNKCTSEN